VKKLQTRLRALQNRRDRGASAVEYGLLVALIAVVIAATVYALGGALKSRFQDANTCVKTPSAAACN
jgi:pilus assembly protein Flp/PilA